MNETEILDRLIKSAERLGGLTPAAIFALVCLVQWFMAWRKDNAELAIKRKENERREAQIVSTERNTEAYKAMAANIIILRDAHNAMMMQVKELYILIQERIK